MVRHAQTNRVQPRRRNIGQSIVRLGRQHNGERSGPQCSKPPRQRGKLCQRFRHRQIGAVHDQRIEPGAPLGLVDRENRIRIGRIAAQAVDGFGRKCADLSRAQQLCGLGDRLGVHVLLDTARQHGGCLTMPLVRVKTQRRINWSLTPA